MFAKRNSKALKHSASNGRVYVLEITLQSGDVIYKIGMTHSPRSADRMMEILRSWFMKYRYVPHTRCRMDYETGVPLLLEKHLHSLLKEFKWVPDKKVDGAQEMFSNIDVDEVISYVKNFDYSILLKGTSIDSVDYEYIITRMPSTVDSGGFDEDVPF